MKKNNTKRLKSDKEKRALELLNNLFQIAPSNYLIKSLTSILLSYLSNTEPEDYKPEIKEICSDFYCLLKFLDEADNLTKKEN